MHDIPMIPARIQVLLVPPPVARVVVVDHDFLNPRQEINTKTVENTCELPA